MKGTTTGEDFMIIFEETFEKYEKEVERATAMGKPILLIHKYFLIIRLVLLK